MSFVVSYQGQFKPYQLPDLSHYDQVHQVYKSLQSKKIKDDEEHYEFEKELKSTYDEGEPQKKNHFKSDKLKSYQQLEKSYHLDKRPQHAHDIMSRPPHCIENKQTLADALEVMEKYTYRHLPVTNADGDLVGMLSDRDLLKHRHEKQSKKIEKVMTPEVLTALESARIQDVVRLMLHEKIGALPIVNDNYRLTGILTQTDILKIVANGQVKI